MLQTPTWKLFSSKHGPFYFIIPISDKVEYMNQISKMENSQYIIFPTKELNQQHI